MRRSSLSGRAASVLLRRRIDHAAGAMIPYLVVLAIGLALLNLTCLALLTPHLRVTRHPSDAVAPRPRAFAGPRRVSTRL